MDMGWYKENIALQAELRREYPAVAELIDELGNKLADEKKAAGHWMEQSCKDHNKAEKLEQQLAHKQEQCDQLAHEVLELEQWQLEDHAKLVQHVKRIDELEQQLSRYQGGVEMEGIIGEDIMTTGRFVQADVPLSFKNRQRVRVLVMPLESEV